MLSPQVPPVCIGSGQSTETADYVEDCLYISVYSPSNATTTSNLPVWFFIQGGGFATNAEGRINGTDVIQASGMKMVFVQINYRVGPYGFLASKKVQANGALNAGLLDQHYALQWVQKYIHLVSGRSFEPYGKNRNFTKSLKISSVVTLIMLFCMAFQLALAVSHTTWLLTMAVVQVCLPGS